MQNCTTTVTMSSKCFIARKVMVLYTASDRFNENRKAYYITKSFKLAIRD